MSRTGFDHKRVQQRNNSCSSVKSETDVRLMTACLGKEVVGAIRSCADGRLDDLGGCGGLKAKTGPRGTHCVARRDYTYQDKRDGRDTNYDCRKQ